MPDSPMPPRPPTPQVLLHRMPDKSPDDPSETTRKPYKYLILTMGSTAVAGKLQIACSVADGLSCPLYQGDSIHNSSAKAATQQSRRIHCYKRKHPLHAAPPVASTFPFNGPSSSLNTVFTLSMKGRIRGENPALMVLTHPELAPWHRLAIRKAVGAYGIGVVFVPLYGEGDEEEDPPILLPLDPTTSMRSSSPKGKFFGREHGWGNLDGEMRLCIDVNADVERKTDEILEALKDVMGIEN
ncbi:hypothetical protein VMCG_08972 [Cytospora schulzeri]|uniref:Uncharacterized protein n=1 Tax=Cytospora schulzeri TaxID=448051 RepID=A0A423VPP2_9PEZI|nr:hypothetical protein VMCG_08972 [Valsa malicola]